MTSVRIILNLFPCVGLVFTPPLVMPKAESERISVADGEVLEKAAIVIRAKAPTNIPKKGKTGGAARKWIPPRAKQTAKQRSVLEVDKYGQDESSKWKRVNAHFPALYKALLAEPDRAPRLARLRQAVSAAG